MKRLTLSVMFLALAGFVLAQDGAPAGSGAKPVPPPKEAPKQDAKKAEVAPLDPAAEAWVDTLAKRIADANQVIRDSAVAGVEKVGKPALPILNKYATGTDKALADAAKKLVERINRGPQSAGPMGRQNTADAVDKVAKDLNLDEKKTQKLKDMAKAVQDKMRDSFESVRNGDTTREEAMAEMQTYREEMKAELRKFLTEDEAKKVEESLVPQRGGRMGGGGGGRGGNRGGGGGG